MLYQLDQTLYW